MVKARLGAAFVLNLDVEENEEYPDQLQLSNSWLQVREAERKEPGGPC